MGALLAQLWTDPVYFRSCLKGFISFIGSLIAMGAIPLPGEGWKIGLAIMSGAQVIPTAARDISKIVQASTPDQVRALGLTAPMPQTDGTIPVPPTP